MMNREEAKTWSLGGARGIAIGLPISIVFGWGLIFLVVWWVW